MDWTFTDAASISGARMTADGYLVAEARSARSGVQTYGGFEVGRPEMETVRVYRPEGEVFHSDALASFAHRPVTNDHPPEAVKAENWKRYAVGQTGGDVLRDGGFVRIPLVVMDSAAIEAIQGGKRELSFGYDCQLDWTSGKTEDGQEYDAVQRSIRGNHLAIVRAGRAGPQCRIGDAARQALDNMKGREMSDTKLKTVVVDGIPIEANDQAAAVIDSFKTKLADAAKAAADAEQANAVAIAAKDKELGAKDAEIADLKSKIVTDAQLDAIVAKRADVISKAKIVDKDVKVEGLSLPAIRRAAVVARMGDAAAKDRSDDYVEALFDGLAAKGDVKDPLAEAARSALADKTAGGSSEPQAIRDAAYQEYLDALNGVKKEGK